MEALGRVLYFGRGFKSAAGAWDDKYVASLEVSKSVGDVALLDTDDNAEASDG
jgi:hypothetical protein